MSTLTGRAKPPTAINQQSGYGRCLKYLQDEKSIKEMKGCWGRPGGGGLEEGEDRSWKGFCGWELLGQGGKGYGSGKRCGVMCSGVADSV